MGRGVSCGGGESSLGYLFGSGEAPPSKAPPAQVKEQGKEVEREPLAKSPAASPTGENGKAIPAGIQGNPANNYFRADGQNSGNFITDRPSTKVHAAPGGGSSLGYLFGDGEK